MSKPLKPKSNTSINKNNVIRSPNLNTPSKKKLKGNSNKNMSAIPKPVANRMAKRIAITTGLPTLSGMGVFIGSYILVSRGIADIPPGVTLLSSAACFLIGLLGLSYGMLSSSWDEAAGSFLGIENIRPNIERIRDAFKSNS